MDLGERGVDAWRGSQPVVNTFGIVNSAEAGEVIHPLP